MPLFLMAHGAGAPSSSAWMGAWAERLSALGPVVRFDYPYMAAGKRMPDRMPTLIAAHAAALDAACHEYDGPIVLIGKSMGARVGCHLSLQAPRVAALICLGYPLQSPSKKVRDEVLYGLDRPVLFVSGGRDPLFPLWTFGRVALQITAPHALHLVMGGDHSLMVSKGRQALYGATQAQSDAAALGAIQSFVEDLALTAPRLRR